MSSQIDTSLSSSVPVSNRRRTDSCLYCGCGDMKPLYQAVRDRLGVVPGDWEFLRCRNCGSGILSPLPAESELAGFYPAVYSFDPVAASASRWRRTLARIEYQVLYRTMYGGDVRRVLRNTLGRDTAGKSLLDVGCGRGYRLTGFRQRGCQVTGTDFQPEVVNYVREKLGVSAYCCGIADMDQHFPPQSFDLVTAFYVLEHVLDVQQTLACCYRLLKPNGWFVAAVPLVDSWQAVATGPRWSQVTEAPRHVSLPTRHGVQLAMQQAGFTQIKLVADSLANCAAAVGLTVVPGGTTSAVYGPRGGWRIMQRLLAVAIAFLSVPWCFSESRLARRPAMGIVFGRRPPGVADVA